MKVIMAKATFESVRDALTLKNYPFLKRGLPMVAIFGAAYYGMSYMTDTMMKHRSARKNILTFEEAERQFGLKLKPKDERKLPGSRFAFSFLSLDLS